ncbi:hypothetical protein UL070_003285 [Salmonella enterica]|nr:hypothetical protein [Salmonella enterica]
MEVATFVFKCIGVAICLLSGITVTGFLAGVVMDYCWRKMRLAHSLIEIQRALKAYKKQQKD